MKRLIISLIMAVLVVFLPACSTKPESRPSNYDIIEEGEIISTEDLESGGVIYVLFEGDQRTPAGIIEVDVFPEVIHTSIAVGDTAIYCRDENWTDADLLAICKNEASVKAKEQTIVELALLDMRDEINPDKADDATLIYLFTETDMPWLEWDCVTYLLIVDDRVFCVGVQEKGYEVHSVDVTEELISANH